VYVVVGTENPVKRAAVERVVAEATVAAVSVDPGVPDQPRGHAETARGAATRARRARAAEPADLGVGIESGVASFPDVPGTYVVAWAAATDGDRTDRAAGPSYRLPAGVAARVADGETLGAAFAGAESVASDRTAGQVDRERMLAAAVAGAVGPFVDR
jgi:inosine/xanthosine triphosphatase